MGKISCAIWFTFRCYQSLLLHSSKIACSFLQTPEVLKLVFSMCGCCTGYYVLILVSFFISFSLAIYNESISRRGKYLFLEGHAHFQITYSSPLLHDLFKNFFIVSLQHNYPWREQKKVFTSCTLPSGTEMLSFGDDLPDSVTHKAAIFHLALWKMWILPKSLTQQYFFVSASHCKFISYFKFSFTPDLFQ